MISKEETKELKECLKETIQNTYAEKKAIKLNNALKYIEELETREQNIIEILEKRLKELDELKEKYLKLKEYEQVDITLYKKREVESILKIMKGENDGL